MKRDKILGTLPTDISLIQFIVFNNITILDQFYRQINKYIAIYRIHIFIWLITGAVTWSGYQSFFIHDKLNIFWNKSGTPFFSSMHHFWKRCRMLCYFLRKKTLPWISEVWPKLSVYFHFYRLSHWFSTPFVNLEGLSSKIQLQPLIFITDSDCAISTV